MLSRDTFDRGWHQLASRFGSVPKDAKGGYFIYLEHRVDDQTFLAAVKYLFANADRFPKPAAFVDAAPGRSLEDWTQLRTWKCEECGDTGRSLGFPKYMICTKCVREIGRDRLRQLKKDGKDIRHLGGAIPVGLGVIREERDGPRI